MTFNTSEYEKICSFIKENKEKIKKTPEIIAISKNQSKESVEQAINYGIRLFGENRVQEAIKKFTDLKKEHCDLKLHLTGPLQTNKVKQAIKIFDVFHTLDREKLAIEFSKHKADISEKKFFIQVNIGKEKQKIGIFPDYVESFVNYCLADLNLNVIGLMIIPPQYENPDEYFFQLYSLAKENNLEFLSMGMSSDYKKALLNGASHIRVGTLLFGER